MFKACVTQSRPRHPIFTASRYGIIPEPISFYEDNYYDQRTDDSRRDESSYNYDDSRGYDDTSGYHDDVSRDRDRDRYDNRRDRNDGGTGGDHNSGIRKKLMVRRSQRPVNEDWDREWQARYRRLTTRAGPWLSTDTADPFPHGLQDMSEKMPSKDDIEDYAKLIGLDLKKDPDLEWIARLGLQATLPAGWAVCCDGDGNIYYVNWKAKKPERYADAPCDEQMKALVRDLRRADPREREKVMRDEEERVKDEGVEAGVRYQRDQKELRDEFRKRLPTSGRYDLDEDDHFKETGPGMWIEGRKLSDEEEYDILRKEGYSMCLLITAFVVFLSWSLMTGWALYTDRNAPDCNKPVRAFLKVNLVFFSLFTAGIFFVIVPFALEMDLVKGINRTLEKMPVLKFIYINSIFAFSILWHIWFLIGSVWAFGTENCINTAPTILRMTVAHLVFFFLYTTVTALTVTLGMFKSWDDRSMRMIVLEDRMEARRSRAQAFKYERDDDSRHNDV